MKSCTITGHGTAAGAGLLAPELSCPQHERQPVCAHEKVGGTFGHFTLLERGDSGFFRPCRINLNCNTDAECAIHYRAYLLAKDDSIIAFQIMECLDDKWALADVATIKASCETIEVWEAARKIGQATPGGADAPDLKDAKACSMIWREQ